MPADALSPAEIAGMRSELGRMLPDTATIRRRTLTSDGGGGQTETWATAAANVPCRISPVAGGEHNDTGASGNRVEQEATAVITFADGTDVTEADRVIVAGRTFDVTLVRLRGAWELSRRVEAREVVR